MSLKIAKPNEPILLTYTVPFYKTDKVVKVEVYSPGTSAAPGNLLSTETLTHQSAGRFAKLYTPPADQDFLDLVYKVYKSDGTTLDLAYTPFIQQLVLNGYSAGGGTYGGTTVQPLSDDDYEKIAEKIWQKRIDKITEKNSAAVYLKQQPETDLAGIQRIVQTENKNLSELGVSIQNMITKGFNKFNTLFDLPKLFKEKFKEKEKFIKEKENIEQLVNKISQSILMFNTLTVLDTKLSDLLLKQKVFQINDFDWFFNDVKQMSKNLSAEQTEQLNNFMQFKVSQVVSEIDNQSSKRMLSSMTETMNTVYDKNSKEAKEIKKSIQQLQAQIAKNEDNLKELAIKQQDGLKEVIMILQNNILALAKLIEKNENFRSLNFTDITTNLNQLKRRFYE
ncbi:MAG: hypothetical protein ACOZAL_01105 [Patescibacteria group bacterium]